MLNVLLGKKSKSDRVQVNVNRQAEVVNEKNIICTFLPDDSFSQIGNIILESTLGRLI